jgi:hypothetical protein
MCCYLSFFFNFNLSSPHFCLSLSLFVYTANQMATAITVESLLALSTIKSFKDKKTTMMQYLIAFLKQTNPVLLDFAQDFEQAVLLASKVDLKSLPSEVSAMKSECCIGESFRGEEAPADLSDDVKADFMSSHGEFNAFLDEANRSIKRAQVEVEIAQAQFKALLDYFLEPDLNMDPQRFFTTMLKFTKEFNDARQAVEKAQHLKVQQN